MKKLAKSYTGTITFVERKAINPVENAFENATLIERRVTWHLVDNQYILFRELTFGAEFFLNPPANIDELQGPKWFDYDPMNEDIMMNIPPYFKFLYKKENVLQCYFDLFKSEEHYSMFGFIYPADLDPNNQAQLLAIPKEFEFFGKFTL